MKPIFAEIITIGDEILYGQITDTNTQWISAELSKIGIKTIRKSSVGDSEEEILKILSEAEGRADIILITGGLGPTKDDITKKTMCIFFEDELEINEHALKFLTDFFEKRNRPLTEINRLQAAIPKKCTYLPNKTGTAPGMWFNKNGKIFVSMPGVPTEMKYLMSYEVIPKILETTDTPVIHHQVIRTIGIGESFLADLIKDWEEALPSNIRLAYLPSFGQVRLRLTAMGQSQNQIIEEVNQQVALLLPQIREYVYAMADEDLEVSLGKILKANNLTIGTAESCTGGHISHLITKVPGSSAYFMGGIVSYDNAVKTNVLGVKEVTLQDFGAVSLETVKEMAEGARRLLGTDYAIATSGIAGPDGGTEEKPVGTICIACASKNKTITKRFQMMNQRETNIVYGSTLALNMLRIALKSDGIEEGF